jgi:prepilin-type N-terminal cleavage/methylation domain-containing protein
MFITGNMLCKTPTSSASRGVPCVPLRGWPLFLRQLRSSEKMRSGIPGTAFTLVELLIVIAILAILCSLLLPSLSRTGSKAAAAQCISNLRQWGLAYRQYADDNKDFLPRRGQGVQPLGLIDRSDDWFNALTSYFGSQPYQQLFAANQKFQARAKSVFVCPAAIDPGSTHFLPYGMNMNLSPWILPKAAKITEVVRPLQVVAMADAPGPYSSTYPSSKPYSVIARHLGRVNLLFLTGQVNSFSATYVGCGVGDPERDDVRWLTGTDSDSTAGNY